MNIELKPCPFCGGEAEMIDVNASISATKRTIYRVECKKGIECQGMPGTHGYDTEREAAAAWNTRAPQAAAEKRNKLRDIFNPTPKQIEERREREKQIIKGLIENRCCTFCSNARIEPHIEHGRHAGEDCICSITGKMRFYPEDNGKNCKFWKLKAENCEFWGIKAEEVDG